MIDDSEEYYIRCGVGSISRRWVEGAPPDSVPASQWETLRNTALSTKHAQYAAADLDGQRLAESFMGCVIGDPKVQACGRWLCLERPNFGPLFEEGKFPTVIDHADPACTVDRPLSATVGYARQKEAWRGLPPGTLCGSGQPLGAFPAPGPVRSLQWNRRWPLFLDASDLITIIVSQYRPGANYQDDPSQGPIHHTAVALADRFEVFFNLLRKQVLVAEGTFRDSGAQSAVPASQWDRRDRYLDLRSNDLLAQDGKSTKAMWESIILRQPKRDRSTRSERPRPAENALEIRLKKLGLADGPHSYSIADIAHKLVDPRLSGEDLDRALDRTRQQLKRYYRRLQG